MDDWKKTTATKEHGNYATPPTPKYKPLNKTMRARLNRITARILALARGGGDTDGDSCP